MILDDTEISRYTHDTLTIQAVVKIN